MITDFKHTTEKLQQRIAELGRAVVRDREPVTDWKVHDGDVDGAAAPDFDDSKWAALTSWDEVEVPSWQRIRVTVPKRFEGEPVVLSLRVGGYDHKLFNAEALAYVNGEFVLGLDAYHNEILLSEHAVSGQEFVVALNLFWKPDFNKTVWQPSPRWEYHDIEKVTELQLIDRAAEHFYWDALTAFETATSFDENSMRGSQIIEILDLVFNMVDYRGPLGDAFYESIGEAAEKLRTDLYSHPGGQIAPRAMAVGQTHIDLAWFWPIDVNRLKIGRTFASMLDLMEKYENFTFFQNQAKVYDYCREDFPDLYDEAKKRISEGRWEVNGGMWTEPDCNLPSGEALVRQLTMGLRFFQQELGGSGDALVIMDAFGYTWALPQLIKRCGMKYFLTNKMSWNQYNRMPYDTFEWKGIDGSTVLAHQLTSPSGKYASWATTCNAELDPGSLRGAWDQYLQKRLSHEILFTYGYGDGGGGPTTAMLEKAERVRQLGSPVRLENGTIQEFFERMEEQLSSKDAPVWNGELYLEFHRGTYTSKGAIKRGNRKGEVLMHDAELFATTANLLVSRPYPREDLLTCWDILLVNQQHDILPGSITDEPERDALRDYAELQEVGGRVVVESLEAIAQQVETGAETLVVFNSLPWRRSGVVKASLFGLSDTYHFTDASGRVVPHQVVSEEDGTTDVLLSVQDVPSCGYTSITVEPGAPADGPESSLSVSETEMENRFFRMEIDGQGRITALHDKVADREVLAAGARGNVFQLFEDKPLNFDAWDIDQFYQDKMWEVEGVESVRVVEKGPVRATVELTRSFGRSRMVQRVQIYDAVPRIDFDTEVEWDEKHTLLKVAFPVQVRNTHATYDIQFGNIERPTHWNTSWDQGKFEVYGHKWADLSEADYGVSLMNDCKYGYDVKDNVMRLSLLRSPTNPDPHTDEGHHEFVYSLYPHQGDWRTGTVRAAYNLNVPMRAVQTGAHAGNLPREFSLVSSSRENVIVETVKLAEDSDKVVVRCYESYNSRGSATLRLGVGVAGAAEVNLLEEDEGPVSVDANALTFDVAPYEVRTFSVSVE